MKFITSIFRFVVGALFIFSGAIKLNDPLGFSYKLEEYFAPDVLNLPFLESLALPIALVVVIAEILLGIALLIGFKRKWTVWLLLAMIVFFTFLTFYSAYFNKVTDCGCFGDAIPLTPWESFTKDLILLVMILWLTWRKEDINPITSQKLGLLILVFFTVASGVFGNYVLHHLPLIDFRHYAVGSDIVKGMMSAQELGLEPPKYETFYVLEDVDTGERKEVSATAYIQDGIYKDKQFKLVKGLSTSKKIADGYEPPIHDFAIYYKSQDITKSVLFAPNYLMIFVKDLDVLTPDQIAQVDELVLTAFEKENIPSVVLTTASADEMLAFYKEYHPNYNFSVMDETTMKTIVRANPGVVFVRGGVIQGKWAIDDCPPAGEFGAK